MRFTQAVQIPHLALPFRFDGPHAAVVEQDSIDEIAGCAEAVLRYRLGSRLEAPTFGIDDQAFHEGGADVRHLREQIADAEPRAVTLIDSVADELEQARSLEEGVDVLRVAVSQAQ